MNNNNNIKELINIMKELNNNIIKFEIIKLNSKLTVIIIILFSLLLLLLGLALLQFTTGWEVG